MRSRGLSKSRILSSLQCPKRLYLETYHRELQEQSADREARFAAGHVVGGLARTRYPAGHLIEHADDLNSALQETEALLAKDGDVVLFEATLQHQGVLFRSDVLVRKSGSIRLVEVKSSTKVKDAHHQDCAIQLWVMRSAGYGVDAIEVAHLNNKFVYQGDGDYTGLFKHVDVTRVALALEYDVRDWVARCNQILAGPVPKIEVDDHCTKPYECPFLSHCLSEGPEYPLFYLPRGGKTVDQIRAEGFKDIRDIPEGRLKSSDNIRVRRVMVSGQPELDPKAAETLRDLPYPRYYLDFETTNPAIPIWAGTRPYQQLPFQWSCHIEDSDGNLHHSSFLDTSGEPPMRRAAEDLLAVLHTPGPIFMYTPFEKTVMKALATMFPDLADALNERIGWLADLCKITRAFYCHPDMKGSWSIKAVLPTVAPDLSYDTCGEVQDGLAAGRAYLEMINPKTDDERRNELITSLNEYCKLDTLAMVRLAKFLQQ